MKVPRRLTDEERASVLASSVGAALDRYRAGYDSELQEDARSLVGFKPEGGMPEALCQFLADHDEWGGRSVEDFRDAPFFCEAVLYPLFGKDDARTLLALARQGTGMTHEEFQIAQDSAR